ncbi:MAG: 2-dehydropantoate 2-reductase [Deltaproteobacteria bacterium]|nr:2-dehydropantoate 2-reductase [Deltaproteobacteria bacterium]
MITKASRICVVGAGAIGGITAALIRRGGYDVELVCKHPELAQAVRTRGVHVTGARGDFWMPMPAVATSEELTEKPDVVFLATKATAMLEAAQRLLPSLKADSLVVSLQNGICEPALAELLGRERVIGCVVGWGATLRAPGELEMTSTGEFVIGPLDGRPAAGLEPLRSMMDLVLPTRLSGDIFSELYSKLIVNACITSLGALCGLTMGEMLASKKARSLFIAIMAEAIAVAKALSIRVPSYGGKLDYDGFLRGSGPLDHLRRHLIIRAIGFKYRRLRSSSLQSLERGQPTEIDFLNGYLSREGKRLGIPTPINDRVVEMIKEIEAGKRRIGRANFKDRAYGR